MTQRDDKARKHEFFGKVNGTILDLRIYVKFVLKSKENIVLKQMYFLG